MSCIKKRLDVLISIKRIMLKNRITIEDLTQDWFVLDEYMDEYEVKE